MKDEFNFRIVDDDGELGSTIFKALYCGYDDFGVDYYDVSWFDGKLNYRKKEVEYFINEGLWKEVSL